MLECITDSQFVMWIQAGVYGKLRKRMGQLHPVLDTLMLEHGYGRVLSRPGLTLRLRELCVIAVLVGQDVSPQLVRNNVRASQCQPDFLSQSRPRTCVELSGPELLRKRCQPSSDTPSSHGALSLLRRSVVGTSARDNLGFALAWSHKRKLGW